MATREENLKKINDKLELMSDEELDKVAGGLLVIGSIRSGNPNDPQNKKFETPKSDRLIVIS